MKLLDFSITSPDIVNIVGGPGFGKSALSFAVGHALLKKGRKVHYVNLRQIKDVEAANFAIFTAVDSGKGLKFKRNLKLLGRWAAAQTRKTVLILDNCDDLIDQSRDSFLELISDTVHLSSILKVLVTSQLKLLSLEKEVRNFHLNPLKKEFSFLLLTQMFCGLSSEHAETLVHLSGNVPLALKLVGALLQDGVDPQTLADELRRHPIRTLSPHDYSPKSHHLSACIGSAYKRLPSTLRHALGSYSLIPGTFDIKSAGGLLNISAADAKMSVVNRLKNRCLIEYDGRSRYEIHRLIAAYVREADPLFESYLLDFEPRYVRHFSTQLLKAAEAYNKNVASKQGLRKFDADQHNFIYLVELLLNFSGALQSKEFVWTKFYLAVKADQLLRIRLPRQRFIRWHDSATLSAAYLLREFGPSKIRPKVICDMIYTALDFRFETKNKTDVEMTAKRYLSLLEMYDQLQTTRVQILRMLCLSDFPDVPVNVSHSFRCHQKESVWLNVSKVTYSLFTLASKYNEMGYTNVAGIFFQHFLDKTALEDDGKMLKQRASAYIWVMSHQPNNSTIEKAILTLLKYAKQRPSDLYAKGKLARYLYNLDRLEEAEGAARSVIMDYKIAYKDEDVQDLTIPLDTLCHILQRKDDDFHCNEFIAVCNRSYTISLRKLSLCAPTVRRLRILAQAIRRCKGGEAAVPYYRSIVSMEYSVMGQHENVVGSFLELAEVLYQSSQYSEYFRVCKDTIQFTFDIEGEFDEMFPSVFASTSTDVVIREESLLSGLVSNDAFPSLNTKKLKSSVQKHTLISHLVLALVEMAPLFVLPFSLAVAAIILCSIGFVCFLLFKNF